MGPKGGHRRRRAQAEAGTGWQGLAQLYWAHLHSYSHSNEERAACLVLQLSDTALA